MATENQTLAQFYSTDRNPFNYASFTQVARDASTAWLTLDQITQQLNLFGDESQDTYLTGLELATRMAIEDYLGYSIFSTQYLVYYGNPGLYNTALYLDLPETTATSAGITVNSLKYYADAFPATLTTLASSGYFYDPTGNRVVVSQLPQTLSQLVANPIQVIYTVNANPIAQYPVIQQAGLLLLTHLYNNRSNSTETGLKNIPFGVDALLRPYKPLVM
jgi:hypothetical protein